MPDITMCTGERKDGLQCKHKDYCYRYWAKPGMRQSWFQEAPLTAEGRIHKCDHLWEKTKYGDDGN